MDEADADLTIYANARDFDRDNHYRQRKHEELEVQVEFGIAASDLTSLILASDEKAAEVAQGREHYVWRVNAEEDGEGFAAEVCMYVMVPRISFKSEAERDA